ncbi:MAG: 1-acyl-sn-glycerol-3-phosphate acyltransferase, partial [Spirochaetaceae bacterium]|nr:1-acyl-sn-glycerol-3-phosphate acyltransferase [Spirochaetaceae bacterium]
MEGQSIREKYGFMFAQMAQVAHAAAEIDETNVFEPANPETRTFMDKLAGENLAEGSKIGCVENFEAF